MKWSSSEQILEESGISVAPPKRNRSSHVLMLAPLAPAITGEVISKVGHKEEEKEEKKKVCYLLWLKFIKLINFPQLGSEEEEEEEEEVGERVKEKEEKITMLSALIKIYKINQSPLISFWGREGGGGGEGRGKGKWEGGENKYVIYFDQNL